MKHIQAYKRILNLLMIIAILTALYFLINAYCEELIPYLIIPFLIIFMIILLMIIRLHIRYQRLEKSLLYDDVDHVEVVTSFAFDDLKQYCIEHGFVLLHLGDVVYAMHSNHNVVLILYQTDYLNEVIHSHKKEIQSFIKQHRKEGQLFYTYVLYKNTLTKEEVNLCLWKNKGAHELMFGYEHTTSSLYYLKNFQYALPAVVNEDLAWIYQEILSMFHLFPQENQTIPSFSFQPYLKGLGCLMLITFLGIAFPMIFPQVSSSISIQEEQHRSNIHDMELQTLTFEVDKDIYMLGEPFVNFYEEGWRFKDETNADVIVSPNTPSSSYIELTRNHEVFYASFYNSSNDPQAIKDCELIAIMQSERMPSASIYLPKGIKVGSTKEEVIQAYGPCEHIVDDLYQYTFAQQATLIITFDSYDRVCEFTYSQF